MKAASISYRVADFLRRHPPFEWMQEDALVGLAMTGRVRFHESQEILHDAGEERQPHFVVIQQGTVELLDDDGGLHDLLGPGDIVGIGSSARHRYCARTASDVLTYVFPQEALRPLLAENQRAQRYLEAVFSLASEEHRPGGLASLGPSGLWLDEPLPADIARCDASLCRVDRPVGDIARRMTREGLSAVAVVDDAGRALGIVRDADFRAFVATGDISPQQPIADLLPLVDRRLAPTPEGRPLGEYWRQMLRCEAAALPVLSGADGSGPVIGVLTENDLALRRGHDPLVPALRIQRARSLPQIRELRAEADVAIEHLLADRNAARWCVEAAGALDVATCRRVIRRAEEELSAGARQIQREWILMGAAGRRERFGNMPLGLGLLWEGDEGERSSMARLAARVGAELNEVGLRLAPHVLPSAPQAPTHGTYADWQEAFRAWIVDPISSDAYGSLGFFDPLPVTDDWSLSSRLMGEVMERVRGEEAFLPLLANDSMAHLPPLTFFRGEVIDKTGDRTERLDLENYAVRPLTDIARVLALQSAEYGECSTVERLESAGRMFPAYERLFRRAAQAFELVLLQRARVAYVGNEDVPEISPENLLKVDRELLKTCFRTILELLEITADHFGFPAPR